MSYLAPAGTPVSLGDIALAVAANEADARALLAESLRGISGLPVAFPVSSGRAAMTLILQAMRNATQGVARDEVIVPAYTCYSVPAAIERAGLKPRLCDVDPMTLGMDPSALARCDFSRVLAVVSANLYGLPNELAVIESVCRDHDVLMLDDAAQALGAKLRGRSIGAFGDAGLYSFDKGKIISTIQGGAIVARQGLLASSLESVFAELPTAGLADKAGNLAKLLIYSICLRPQLYDLIRRVPFTGLGHTIYEPRYPVTRLAKFQAALAAAQLKRLGELNAGRRRNAMALQEAISDLPGVTLVATVPGAEPVFARFPIRIHDARRRVRLLAAFDRAGIGASASYPAPLADVPQVAISLPPADRKCPGSREIAATIVTLPTHAYCPPDLPARVRAVIRGCPA